MYMGTTVRALGVSLLLTATSSARDNSVERRSDRADRSITIDFSDHFNIRNDTDDLHEGGFFASDRLPTGSQTFRTVPFELGQPHGLYAWSAAFESGTLKTLDIDTSIENPRVVYTLINSLWGVPGEAKVAIEFLGSDGAFHREQLVGNQQIRDYNANPSFTNQILASNTTRVFSTRERHGQQRMDMQVWELPEDFHDEKLAQIRIVDTGALLESSAIVFGITVETVDEDRSRRELVALLDQARTDQNANEPEGTGETGPGLFVHTVRDEAKRTSSEKRHRATEIRHEPTLSELVTAERDRRSRADSSPASHSL